MYESLLGYTRSPFMLDLALAASVGGRGPSDALGTLGAGQGEGFAVVIGKRGARKATLPQKLLARAESASIVAAQIARDAGTVDVVVAEMQEDICATGRL